MAKETKAAAAATTTSGKDRSRFKAVVLDSYMWSGARAKSPLIGRIIGTEKMQTKYKSAKNPDGVVPVILMRTTEPASWLDDGGNLVEAPTDADVKVVVTAGLEGFARQAILALASGKAPEVVLEPTGQTKTTPNGQMKLYGLRMEPVEEWPALADFAGDVAFTQEMLSALPSGVKQLSA